METHRHRCKLCFKNFANGRALGGHMRSHVMNFSSSKNASSSSNKLQFLEDSDEPQSIHSSSSSRGEEENPTTSPELLSFDGESETESLAAAGYARCRRRKRRRKTRAFSSENIRLKRSADELGEINEEQLSPLSSVSDTTTEEDVAHCLMMLSRDQWERENESNNCGGGDDDSEDSSAGHAVKVMKLRANKVRGKYKCETCNKLFKSYQALGGHRASYKKIKADVTASRPGLRGGRAAAAEEKVHECPFCHRIFASGQALGGHKRSHFMGASSNVKNVVSRNVENLDIDLNLPAPLDDEDGNNFSKQ